MSRTAGTLVLLFSVTLTFPVAPALAQDDDPDGGSARLTVCNKGTRRVSVGYGAQELDPLAPTLQVSAWFNVEPGKCSVVYETISDPIPAYLAFAFISPQGQVTPARMASIPDIGTWTHSTMSMILLYKGQAQGPALTRSARQLCVNQGPIEYSVPANDPVNCSRVRAKGSGDALTPAPAQVFFHPSPRRCATFVTTECRGGRYYLDVAPKAGDLELHAARAVNPPEEPPSQAPTPQQNARELARDFRDANAAARAILNGRLPGPRAGEPLEFTQKRAQWWTAAPRPASAYQASWTGQILVVRGTVASVGDVPVDAPIRFKETPNLTVCVQYPNRLRQVYGADLNVLVGKAIEVTGEVQASTGFRNCGTSPMIYIIEVEQFRVQGAR